MADDLARNRDAMAALFASDAYLGRLGARLDDWDGGWSRIELEVADHHRNFLDLLHGGVTFGVGDLAFSVACNAWGRMAVALAVDVQFLGSAAVGHTIVAEATERHCTRRTGAYLVEVSSDGRLLGSLHALAHRTSRWHLGEDAWSPEWREQH